MVVTSNDWQNHHAAFTSSMPVTLDSLQEFRVTTGGANSTDGLASGPQIGLVNEEWNRPIFTEILGGIIVPPAATANSYFSNLNGGPRAALIRNIPGGSVGRIPGKKPYFSFSPILKTARIEAQFSPHPRSVASDALRDGALIYACIGTNTYDARARCVRAGSDAGLKRCALFFCRWRYWFDSPHKSKTIDPLGIGIDPKMLAYMALFPHPAMPLANRGTLVLPLTRSSFNCTRKEIKQYLYGPNGLQHHPERPHHNRICSRAAWPVSLDNLTPGTVSGPTSGVNCVE